MSVARALLRGGIRLAGRLGVDGLVLRSEWRRRRLLILCYHGFAKRDEHRWDPALYMSAEQFERRLVLLRQAGAALLPLDEALARLKAGTLPARAVALTVDDGAHDFLAVAQPVLKRHAVPATLYCSTWYMQRDWPVFDVMLRYLLWRGVENRVGPIAIGDLATPLMLATRPAAETAAAEVRATAVAAGWSGAEKQQLLERLAPQVGEDLDELMEARLFHLLRLEELAQLDARLVSVQLHTHRHRSPDDRATFVAEVLENRAVLAGAGLDPEGLRHFCYPSGVYRQAHLPWLREAGVVSATTCDPGLATPGSDPLLLPRFVDAGTVPDPEFLAWVSGLRHLLRRRRG